MARASNTPVKTRNRKGKPIVSGLLGLHRKLSLVGVPLILLPQAHLPPVIPELHMPIYSPDIVDCLPSASLWPLGPFVQVSC